MTKTVLVTGANKGLGYETCRKLAEKGFSVLLTARNAHAGQQAADRLKAQGLDVSFRVLDVASDESIGQLADYLGSNGMAIDVLVNNAGVFLDPPPDRPDASIFSTDRAVLRATMETNVYGAIRVAQALNFLLRPGGRIINISSGMGQLSEMNGHCPAYRISKTALNAVTRIMAHELKHAGIAVNSVCPGWVKTDMGGGAAPLEPEQGVDTTVWLATTEDCPSGGFFRERKAIDW